MNPEANSGDVVATNVANNTKPKQDNLVRMSDHPNFNFALALAWLVALLSILGTFYFWWLNKNIADSIGERQQKKDDIELQIQSPTFVKVEKDALDFKSSVEVLTKAYKDRFSMAKFLPELYTKITNDTQIQGLSVDSKGSVSITGTTKNYRTTADLYMALNSWSKLTGVEIGSVTLSSDEEGGNTKAVFSITATLNKAKTAETLSPTTNSAPATLNNLSGGVK